MSSASEDQTTLLSRMGGIPALRAVIDEFYDRILDDERLAPFFDGVNMSQLKLHQLKFLKLALTKIPDEVDAPSLIVEKHMRLFEDKGLNESHFDVVAGHLSDTLKHLGVPQSMIDEAIGIVGSLRTCFVEKNRHHGLKDIGLVGTKGSRPGEDFHGKKKSRFLFSRFIRKRALRSPRGRTEETPV